MLKLLNALRILCLVLALGIIFSGVIFASLNKPMPLTLLQRFGLILPFLALFNVATAHIRKQKLLAAQSKDAAAG